MTPKAALSLSSVFVFALFGALALPLIGLAFYNVPSAADDFCFALNTLKFGFWQGQQYYYDGWTGRYFSTMLMHANPLVWGWFGWYKVFPVLVLGLLGHSFFCLLNAFTERSQSRWQVLVCTAGFVFLYLYGLPSVVENFFWLPGVVGYPVPLILMAYLFAELIERNSSTPKRPVVYALRLLWASFLVFAVVGSNETPLLALTILLGSVMGLRLLYRLPLNAYWLGLLGVLGCSIYLDLSAPGNALRMSYNPVSGLLIPSVISSLQETFVHIADWVLHTPLLWFTAFFVPIASQWLGSRPSHRLFELHPAFTLLIWLGVMSVGIFPGYYGVGIAPPPRTINVVYWLFLFGWFYNVLVILHFGQQRWSWQARALPRYAKLIMAVSLLHSLSQNPNARMLYGDLLKGRARAYQATMQARYAYIDQHKMLPMVAVDSLVVRPKSLFTEDISGNPAFLWNTCQAEYWGIKAIKIKPSTHE